MQVRYLRPAKQMPEIYLYRAPVDFRKQANGLALLIEQELGCNPFSGALYAFTNRQRNKIKCVMWEDNGFVMYYKALAEEKFKCLSAAELRFMVAQCQAVVEKQNTSLLEQNARLENQKSELNEAHRRIALLEEINRLLKIQKFTASSEKSKFQFNLFDETELEVEINTLLGALPETDDESTSIAHSRSVTPWQKMPFVPSPLAVKTGCLPTHAKAQKPAPLVTH